MGGERIMSLFSGPEEHAANPPSSWQVVKAGPRLWHLTTRDGGVLKSEQTKTAAEAERESGFYVNLYEKERRWYAGEPVPGWKPYKESGS
jgi:hypothetical protein